MNDRTPLSAEVLDIADPEVVITDITTFLAQEVRALRRRGAVVALSGGIDSTVTAALCVRAFGPERVLGLLMPEEESSPDTLSLSRLAAESLGIDTVLEDMTATLQAAGCYRRRDEAIRRLIPEYEKGWKVKLVLPSLIDSEQYRISSLVVLSPDGTRTSTRLPPDEYRQVVAATNFKQRSRKMMEYYHADRMNYAVMGTPNRLEYDQGFFVKNGDGSADVKPIAHLYKTQVYRLAEVLGVPEEIRSLPPTADTYSLPQSQDEFYFSLPYHQMDLCLYAVDNDYPAAFVGDALGFTSEQVERVLRDIAAKRRVSHYLHAAPRLFGSADGPQTDVT